MRSVIQPGRLDPAALIRRDKARQSRSALFAGLVAAFGIATALLVTILIGTILVKGLPSITWPFLSQAPMEGMTSGGIWPMIRGTLLLMAGTFVFVLPIGVLGGVYLALYAPKGRVTNAFRACVMSLAGTPSIVYGLFGLAIFVLMLKLGVSLIAGWATLAIMALPVIVLATEQAVKAVPQNLVEGGYALGLTQWQTVWKIVLPVALPGILTGVVLSSGRAAGEAPPILLTAGIYYSTGSLALGVNTLREPVANLPYHLAEGYRQGGVIPEKIVWGTCLTLLSVILLINLGAILVRSYVRRRVVL